MILQCWRIAKGPSVTINGMRLEWPRPHWFEERHEALGIKLSQCLGVGDVPVNEWRHGPFRYPVPKAKKACLQMSVFRRSKQGVLSP
jgi:hypothetical protein